MTKQGDRARRSSSLRPGEEMKPLEAAARSRSEADWVVGHERHPRGLDPPARRLRRRRLARPRPDADARAGRPPRGGDPRLQARAVLARRGRASRPPGERHYSGRYMGGKRIAEDEAAAIVEAVDGQARRRSPSSRRRRSASSPQLLYDLTSLQRHANTLYGFSARRTLGGGAAALRGAQGAHLPAHELALPDRRHGRRDQADAPSWSATTRSTRRAPSTCSALDKLPLGRVVNDKKVQDHHAIIPTRSEHDLGRRWAQDELKIYDLVAKRFLAVFHPEAVFERTRVETTVEEHVFRTSGRRLVEAGWKRRLRRGGRRREQRRRRLGRRPAAAEARAGRDRRDAARSSRCARRPSRRGASPRPRCSARWRPPARTSRTPSCARR